MKNKFSIIVILLISFGSIFAQLDRSKRPASGPNPVIKVGEYKEFQLDNGFKVFVVENHKLPKITFSLVIDRDPILEGNNAGFISLAGSMIGTATKTRTKEQIDEQIDILGARLSASETSVSGSFLSKYLEKYTSIFSDVVMNAKFLQPELDKVKKQLKSGLASQKVNPNSIAENVKNALVYGLDHPYGEQITEETVETVNLEMIQNYYKNYFIPNISYLAIVGDITPEAAKELVNKYFGNWKKSEVEKFSYKKPKAPFVRKIALNDRSSSVQSVIHFAYPVNLKIGSDDAIKARVLNTILGGGFSSRLNQNLREKHAFTYGARSRISSDKLVGIFDATCEARNAVTDSVISEMISEFNKLRNEKVSEKELSSTKNYLTGIFSRSLEQPATIARFALNIARYNLPKDYYANYIKNLKSVTVDDLQTVAKKYITPDNAYIVVVGNAAEIKDGLKKFSMSGKLKYYDVYGNKVNPNIKKLPKDITVEKILDNYANAIGGSEKYIGMKDQTMVLNGETRGMKLKLTIITKSPNKLFQELDFGMGKQVTKFNGVTGKQMGMAGEKELTGTALNAIKLQATKEAQFNYAKFGITAELEAIENIEGIDAYKVSVVSPDSVKSTEYFEVATGLKIRTVNTIKSPQGQFTSIIDYKDYVEQDGIKVPSKMIQQVAGQNLTFTLEKIEFNKGVEDSLFN